ncbi:MAG: AMIN domain-containing protein [Nitrincola sp.]|nr:AMIN domain-containing protein [Nitrincola sp.]
MNVSTIKSYGLWLMGVLIACLSVQVSAQQARLINTEFVSLPGQAVEVRMEFDSVPSTPNSYMIDSPPRLVMDFNNVTNQLGGRTFSVNTGVVDSLNFAQAQDRLRVVTNLLGTATHDVRMDGNVLVLRFQEAITTTQSVPAAQVMASSQPVSDGRTRIQSIDFQRVEGNQGRVIINMNNDRASMDITREAGNVVLNLSEAVLDSSLARRLDVQDFATPLQFIDSMTSGRVLLLRPTSQPFDYMAYQTGNQLIIDFKPITTQEQQARRDNQFPFTGERIDLNFQNVEVRAVLQIIAEVAEMNLVVSDNVSGTATLRLKNVPWDSKA